MPHIVLTYMHRICQMPYMLLISCTYMARNSSAYERICDVSAPYMPVSVHIWLSNLTYEGALPYMQNICAHIRHSTDKYMAYDSNIWQHNLHIWPIYDISVWGGSAHVQGSHIRAQNNPDTLPFCWKQNVISKVKYSSYRRFMFSSNSAAQNS